MKKINKKVKMKSVEKMIIDALVECRLGRPKKKTMDVKKNRCIRISDKDIDYIKHVLEKKSLQEFVDDAIFNEKNLNGE